jgi:hypothetical protein
MRSAGPKAVLPVGGEPLVARQVRLLRGAYPGARFVVVVGFEAHRVRRALAGLADVRVVVNREYETTNVARSLELGLGATGRTRPALVVYGDLVFNAPLVAGLPTARSTVVRAPPPAGGPGCDPRAGEYPFFPCTATRDTTCRSCPAGFVLLTNVSSTSSPCRLPTVEIAASELAAGIGVLNAFVKVGLVPSTGEARRQVKSGGLRVNDAPVTDERAQLSNADLMGEGVIKLSFGRKKHILLAPRA